MCCRLRTPHVRSPGEYHPLSGPARPSPHGRKRSRYSVAELDGWLRRGWTAGHAHARLRGRWSVSFRLDVAYPFKRLQQRHFPIADASIFPARGSAIAELLPELHSGVDNHRPGGYAPYVAFQDQSRVCVLSTHKDFRVQLSKHMIEDRDEFGLGCS